MSYKKPTTGGREKAHVNLIESLISYLIQIYDILRPRSELMKVMDRKLQMAHAVYGLLKVVKLITLPISERQLIDFKTTNMT